MRVLGLADLKVSSVCVCNFADLTSPSSGSEIVSRLLPGAKEKAVCLNYTILVKFTNSFKLKSNSKQMNSKLKRVNTKFGLLF